MDCEDDKGVGEIMEQSTKTILIILGVITLPITIPLAIISGGMILSVLYIILCIFILCIQEMLISASVLKAVTRFY